MAANTPNPKSYEQILGDMLSTYISKIGVNDLNTGGVMISFFEAVAQSVYRTSADTFSVLRDFNVDRATGEKLKRIAEEESIVIDKEKVATGVVTVRDTSFEKKATKIYAGANPPNIGSTVIRVSDASEFPSSGSIYIGRGTPNIEGPLSYNAVAPVGGYYEITLDNPTTKFHNISENVILSQGGVRTIPSGTVVNAPASGTSPSIGFTVTEQSTILDGENFITGVPIAAQETGDTGNVPRGAIKEFASPPFTGASVTNETKFTTGKNADSDQQIRDKIKRARISRGLGTAIAVKNAVLGAQASDENTVVTSNEIFSDADSTTLFIDNGEGYEERTDGIGLEFIVDSALGGEQFFQLSTGGRQTSVAKAFLPSNNSSPFDISGNDKLSLLVGGKLSEHTFQASDFVSEGNATAFEIVSSINANPDVIFSARTIENGTKITIFAREEENEFIQKTVPTFGNDAGFALGLPSSEVQTLRLYRNKKPINRNGRTASILSEEQITWSNSITNGDTLIVSVDGTPATTYTFTDSDFLAEGQHPNVNKNNTLTSWVNVINNKVTGVTASINGNRIVLISNLGASSRASIEIDPLCDFVSNGIFTSSSGLSAEGKLADFSLSRNTAQFKLTEPLEKGESLTAGSEFTRGSVESEPILGGSVSVVGDAYLWFLVDNKDALIVNNGVSTDSTMQVTKPSANIVRYESNVTTAFQNTQIGDWVIIWSEELDSNNRLEAKVYNSGANFIELRVTPSEWASAVEEGPVVWREGLQIVRTDKAIQKVKVPSATYGINALANLLNDSIEGATVRSEKDELLIIETKTEETTGEVFLTTFNDSAKSLNFTEGQRGVSEDSLFAFYETESSDRDFPLFVHSEVAALSDRAGDPPDTLIPDFESTIDLSAIGIDPNVIVSMLNPYNNSADNISTNEGVQIDSLMGATIDIDESQLIRRLREADRYYVADTFHFAANDSIVVILDSQPSTKTFTVPFYREATTNNTKGIDDFNFRAYDSDSGDTEEFVTFFGSDFSFKNYKVFMKARTVLHPTCLPLVNEDAILYRCAEWGRTGEKYNIGYTYPTAPNQEIGNIIQITDKASIRINLKSGDAITSQITSTTEWNVTISTVGSVDQVTYTYSGTGDAPNIDPSLSSGGYATINQQGEFNSANTGTFRVITAGANFFTVVRKIGDAVTESNIATGTDTTITLFEKSDTTATEIVEYVTDNLSDYITAEIIDDNGDTGSGVIFKSTEEDTSFVQSGIDFVDGINWIELSDLAASAPDHQFRFKKSLTLPFFSTATANAYAFNNGEKIRLMPTTAKQTSELTNVLAVSGFSTLGRIDASSRENKLQLKTQILGSGGSLQITGGSANATSADVLTAASKIPNTELMKVSIPKNAAEGFQADHWVKLQGNRAQKKSTGISFATVVNVTPNEPTAGVSKIELENREAQDLYFGEPRNFFRDRGRTFHVEKHGQLTCISWNGVGDSPVMSKNVDINFGASDIAVDYNEATGFTEYIVESGSINFIECQKGDKFTISGLSVPENDGTFNVIGVSDDGKTIVVDNFNGVDAPSFAVNEQQKISFLNVPTSGSFEIEFDGQTTAPIAWNALAADVESALELLSNIDDVSVTGDFSVGFTVEFLGSNANTDVVLMTIPTNTLVRTVSQIEDFDFTGLTGADLNDSTSQIEDFDFTGLTGADFDSVGNGLSFNLAGNLGYVWFNVLNQAASFTGQVAGMTTDVTIDADNTGEAGNIIIVADSISDIDALILDWNTTNPTNTITLSAGDGTQIPTANITLTGGSDSVNIQSDPTGMGTAVQVDLLSTDTAVEISSKSASEITTAAIAGVDTAIDSANKITVTYDEGDITPDGADVDSGAAYTKVQDGTLVSVSKSLQLADGLGYLWFNVTDVAGSDTDPTGTGDSIEVQILEADSASQISSKAAAAATLALPAGVTSVISSGNKITATYDGGVIAVDGADVDSGAAYTKVESGFGPENTTTTVTEEVQGGNLDSLVVTAEIREGDTVSIDAPFSTLNRGDYKVIRKYENSIYIENSSTVEEIISISDDLRSLGFDGTTEFDVVRVSSGVMKIEWNTVGTEPSLSEAKYGDVVTIGSDFDPNNQGEYLVVKTGDNFIECLNATAVNESGVTIADILEVHKPSIKFSEYNVTLPNDKFVVSGDVFNNTNIGEYKVVEVLDKNTAVVNQILATVSSVQLEDKFSQVYVEEANFYVGYKNIQNKLVDPTNSNRTNLIFNTQDQFLKINKDAGEVTLSVVGKLNFSLNIKNGLDSYRYHIGLIGEANRIVYGDPADSSTYPGVSAAGAEIFIQPPLVRRVEIGVGVRLNTGIPFNKIIEQVRANIASLINSSPIGQSIAISDIVASVNSISGVRAVSITSPLYDVNNDVIVVNPSEKPFILDEVNDISVSKVE